MDIATFCGNCAEAEVLSEAGAEDADLLLAATSADETNLLCAVVAKKVGVAKTIARVWVSVSWGTSEPPQRWADTPSPP